MALDNSILATCLPRLANVFHTDSSVIAWVNLAYFVMSQSLMLTLGKMGDAGALFSSNKAEILARLSHMAIDLPTAKKMASIAGYQETILVGLIIASIGIFTSLIRGPRQKS